MLANLKLHKNYFRSSVMQNPTKCASAISNNDRLFEIRTFAISNKIRSFEIRLLFPKNKGIIPAPYHLLATGRGRRLSRGDGFPGTISSCPRTLPGECPLGVNISRNIPLSETKEDVGSLPNYSRQCLDSCFEPDAVAVEDVLTALL